MPDPARTLWHSPTLDLIEKNGDDPGRYTEEWTNDPGRVEVDTPDAANLVSSLTKTGHHAPVLDIDYPARLVPSSTPGHFHLYLEKEIPWGRYQLVLWALSWAGLIEPGFFRAALARKMTFARLHPTKPKPTTKEMP